MTNIKAWIHAARLRTLPLSLSGIIAGSAIAYQDNIFDGNIFFLALLTTLLFQILSNFANDLGDTQKGADNEHRVGPQRAIQSGQITMTQMKVVIALTSLLSLISAALLIYVSSEGKGWQFWTFYLFLALFCILAAITYTVGKRAYGYHGWGDVFVFLFFGIVSVVGVYHLYPKHISLENIEWKLFLPAIAIGALSTAVLNLNNMRDRINDEKVGKKTLVVMLGKEKSKIYHAFLILTGILSWSVYLFVFTQMSWVTILLVIPILIFLIHLVKVMKVRQEQEFDPFLKVVSLTTFLMSWLFYVDMIF